MKRSRGNHAIILDRVREVSRLLIDGNSREMIVQTVSKKYNITERQGDSYIKKAKQIITNSVIKDMSYDYSLAIQRYEELYEKCKHREDFRTSAFILKQLCELQGLFKEGIEHSGKVNFICSFSE